MYSAPERHYHNLRHISECLEAFDSTRHFSKNPLAVELAIWFHDVVYNSRASDNEEQSAVSARQWLSGSGSSEELLGCVESLVLATKAHDASLDIDAPLLVDIDLAILGQKEIRFREYEAQIRAEYSWVPQSTFVTKRAEILERFLGRQRIYSTDFFFERFEVQARRNLRWSIDHLRNLSSPSTES